MRCVVQRVSRASVTVDSQTVGAINAGLLVLVGITHTDTEAEAQWMADKLLTLRVFSDSEGKMNLSVKDVGGGLLLVSQFTLYGDLKKGTRPSFIKASRPEHAEPLFNYLLGELKGTEGSSRELKGAKGSSRELKVESGVFGAMMQVELVNDGPVTIVLDRGSDR